MIPTCLEKPTPGPYLNRQTTCDNARLAPPKSRASRDGVAPDGCYFPIHPDRTRMPTRAPSSPRVGAGSWQLLYFRNMGPNQLPVHLYYAAECMGKPWRPPIGLAFRPVRIGSGHGRKYSAGTVVRRNPGLRVMCLAQSFLSEASILGHSRTEAGHCVPSSYRDAWWPCGTNFGLCKSPTTWGTGGSSPWSVLPCPYYPHVPNLCARLCLERELLWYALLSPDSKCMLPRRQPPNDYLEPYIAAGHHNSSRVTHHIGKISPAMEPPRCLACRPSQLPPIT